MPCTTRGAPIWAPLACLVAALAVPAWGQDLSFDYTDEAAAPGEPYNVFAIIHATKGWNGKTEARIAFDAQDDANLAFVALTARKATLVHVRQGRSTEVAANGKLRLAGQAEVTIQRRPGLVRVIVRDEVVLSAPFDDPLGGKAGHAGLGGPLKFLEFVLQPVADVHFTDDFTRGGGEMGAWEIVSGRWENTEVNAPGADLDRSANPFSFSGRGDGGALALTGHWMWSDYTVRVACRPVATRAVGLGFYVLGEDDYLMLRWREGPDDLADARQLIHVRSGKETILAKGRGGFEPSRWYALEADVRGEHVTCRIDREPILQARTTALGQGRVALWTDGQGTVFDDLVVLSGAEQAPTPLQVTERFLQDATMKAEGLYTPEGAWVSTDKTLRSLAYLATRPPGEGVLWHRGLFYADLTITLPTFLPAPPPRPNRATTSDAALRLDGQLVLVRPTVAPAPPGPTALIGNSPITFILAATPDGPASGYGLALERSGNDINVTLKRQGVQVANGTATTDENTTLTVRKDGGDITVLADGVPALAYTDTDPLTGRHLGLVAANAAALMPALRVASDHHFDYTFYTAPTDWYESKGNWHVTTRWPCQPGWTFFGGDKSENPTLWTKHEYDGDHVFEARANIQMDLPPGPGYSRPSDANLALCGDGVRLDSGYLFVYAGWDNTKSAILRKGQVVAENTGAVFIEPTSSNENFHRHWFRLRAEKEGPRLRFWCDDRLVCEYTDPDPLRGGRAGIWTAHNGIMVGRAQIWFDEERAALVPRRPVLEELPPVVSHRTNKGLEDDFEQDTGEWRSLTSPLATRLSLDSGTAAGGRQSLKVTNLQSGGPFAAYAIRELFHASDWGKLSFDYRIPPGVMIDCYLYLGEKWHAIRLTGNTQPMRGIVVLGDITGAAADDKWHHADFDLIAQLKQLYPQRKLFPVEFIAFSAPEEPYYLRCGLGGNPLGAAYWIDNFRITP